MRTVLALLIGATLVACPRPTPQPVTIPNTPTTCASASPVTEDVCDGLFTVDGYACVRCPDATGCIDAVDGVYCTNGPCTEDPRCASRPAGKGR